MTLRPAVLLFLAATLAFAQADKAVIEGKVVSTTGAPLSKATLTLAPVGAPAQSSVNGPTRIITSTGVDGTFKFENVDAGSYTLSAQRVAHVMQFYGARGPGKPGTPLEVLAGAHLTGLTLEMAPQGLISGKILDEDGDPVSNAQIGIYQLRYIGGRRQLRLMGMGTLSPDSTYMAGNLAPGRYYVGASTVRFSNVGERTQTARPAQAAVTTYYPSAAEYTSGIPVEVTAGADLRGIDIRLVTGRVYQIRGKVTGLPDPSADRSAISNTTVTLGLSRKDGNSDNFAPVDPRDGTFLFRNVPPGEYSIQSERIMSGQSDPSRLIAYLPVTVTDQDLDGVTVEAGPGAEVVGVVRIEGKDDPPTQVRIVLIQPDGFGANNTATDRTGAFQIRSLTPRVYRVNVTGLLAGTYVKAIRAGTQEIAPDKLDLSAGSVGPLEILLSPEAAEVSGTVRNEKNDAIPNATVALWQPVDPNAAYNFPPRQANSDQNGSFNFGNLPPGEYLLSAWEDLEQGVAQNPDFLARYEASAPHVKLTASGRMAMDVKAVDAESAASEVARLP